MAICKIVTLIPIQVHGWNSSYESYFHTITANATIDDILKISKNSISSGTVYVTGEFEEYVEKTLCEVCELWRIWDWEPSLQILANLHEKSIKVGRFNLQFEKLHWEKTAIDFTNPLEWMMKWGEWSLFRAWYKKEEFNDYYAKISSIRFGHSLKGLPWDSIDLIFGDLYNTALNFNAVYGKLLSEDF